MPDSITYIFLPPAACLPDIKAGPSKFVLVLEANVSCEWKKLVSEWIVDSGCLYMMAWGQGCSAWDDSVDWANSEKFGEGPIPEDKFVVTTWHDGEPLKEVFWYAKSVADHRCVALVQTIILHISLAGRKEELLNLFDSA